MSLRQTPRYSSPLRVRISEWRVVGNSSTFAEIFTAHVEYLVETSEGSDERMCLHTAWRRFSDFQMLHEVLGIEEVRLPSKGGRLNLIGGFGQYANVDWVEERKVQLEEYLRRLLVIPQAICSSALWTFLDADLPESSIVPRLIACPESTENLQAVETLALDPRSNFRLHNRTLAMTLLEIVSSGNGRVHSALVILRSMLIGNFALPTAEQFFLPLLRLTQQETDTLTEQASRGVVLDLVEKFPDALFFFFQREAGIETLIQEVQEDDRKSAVIAEVLWLGVAASRDACIALTEKNSKGPDLFVLLARNFDKFPGLPLLLAASISVLARSSANAQPRLFQILEKVVNRPGNFWKFPTCALTVLFRSERGSRKILEIVDREDLPSRFACLLISAVARSRPDLLPVRKELGEQLLKSIRGSIDVKFRVLAAETLLTVAGFTETLLTPEERSELLKFVIGNLKLKRETLDPAIVTQVGLLPISPGVSPRPQITETFEREMGDLFSHICDLNDKRKALSAAKHALRQKATESQESLDQLSVSLNNVDAMVERDLIESSPALFDRLNMEEAEIRSILEQYDELRFETLKALKDHYDHFVSLEEEEKQLKTLLLQTVNEFKTRLDDMSSSLSV